jgi:hypothetical protein
MESIEKISLNEIPQLSIYYLYDNKKGCDLEKGIALIYNKGTIKKFLGNMEQKKDEPLHEFLSQEAINYLRENPFTTGEFTKKYFNTPEKGLTLTLTLNRFRREYLINKIK